MAQRHKHSAPAARGWKNPPGSLWCLPGGRKAEEVAAGGRLLLGLLNYAGRRHDGAGLLLLHRPDGSSAPASWVYFHSLTRCWVDDEGSDQSAAQTGNTNKTNEMRCRSPSQTLDQQD